MIVDGTKSRAKRPRRSCCIGRDECSCRPSHTFTPTVTHVYDGRRETTSRPFRTTFCGVSSDFTIPFSRLSRPFLPTVFNCPFIEVAKWFETCVSMVLVKRLLDICQEISGGKNCVFIISFRNDCLPLPCVLGETAKCLRIFEITILVV